MSFKQITFGKDLNLILIGNCNTGKTCYLNRWTKDNFIDIYTPTMITELGLKVFEKNDILYKIQIWDLSGNDNNKKALKVFAKNTDGCIIFSNAIDIKTRIDSLKWKNSINSISSEIPCILVESKNDLIDHNKVKEYEDKFQNFYKQNEFIGGFLVSSKNGNNISESADFLLDKILEKKIDKIDKIDIDSENKKEENEKENEKEVEKEKSEENEENKKDKNKEKIQNKKEEEIKTDELIENMVEGLIKEKEKDKYSDCEYREICLLNENNENNENKNDENDENDENNEKIKYKEKKDNKKDKENYKLDIDFEILGENELILKLKLKKYDNNEDNIYVCKVNLDKLKKKYDFLLSVDDPNEFIEILKRINEKNKIIIEFCLEKYFIRANFIFSNLSGHEKEIIFILFHENLYNNNIKESLVKEIYKTREEIKMEIMLQWENEIKKQSKDDYNYILNIFDD